MRQFYIWVGLAMVISGFTVDVWLGLALLIFYGFYLNEIRKENE